MTETSAAFPFLLTAGLAAIALAGRPIGKWLGRRLARGLRTDSGDVASQAASASPGRRSTSRSRAELASAGQVKGQPAAVERENRVTTLGDDRGPFETSQKAALFREQLAALTESMGADLQKALQHELFQTDIVRLPLRTSTSKLPSPNEREGSSPLGLYHNQTELVATILETGKRDIVRFVEQKDDPIDRELAELVRRERGT